MPPTTKWSEYWGGFAVRSAKAEPAKLFIRKWAHGGYAALAVTTAPLLPKELKSWPRVMKKELLTPGCGVRCRATRLRLPDSTQTRSRNYDSERIQDAGDVVVACPAGDGSSFLAGMGTSSGAHGGLFLRGSGRH